MLPFCWYLFNDNYTNNNWWSKTVKYLLLLKINLVSIIKWKFGPYFTKKLLEYDSLNIDKNYKKTIDGSSI